MSTTHDHQPGKATADVGAGQEQAEGEALFGRFFRGHSAVMLLVDVENRCIIDVNRAAELFYGWSRESFVGMGVEQVCTVPPEEIEAQFHAGGIDMPGYFETRHRCRDGSLRDVALQASRIEQEGRHFALAVVHDITLRKRYEGLAEFRYGLSERIESTPIEELLQSVVDEGERLTASSVGFCHFHAGELAPELMVWSSGCIKRAHPHLDMHSHPDLHHAGVWMDAMREERVMVDNDARSVMRRRHIPAGHEGVLHEIIVPIRKGSEIVGILGFANKEADYAFLDEQIVLALAGIALEFLMRKRAADAEAQAQQMLQSSHKLELVGQLAGGIAHDFNNISGIIIGFAESALQRAGAGEAPFEELDAILRAAHRSADLTGKLLAFARRQTSTPQVAPLDEVVGASLTFLQKLIGEGVSLEWRPGALGSLVRVDSSQCDQMLVNLCLNACDAIEGNGKVTISSGSVEVTRAMVQAGHCCKVVGTFVRLSVSDNGRGIPAEMLPHLFEPFFTTKEQGHGSGLGLSVVYGIIKQNGGYVECASRPGNGATFTLYFPEFNTAGPDAERAVLSAENPMQVMIVEDEPEIVELCRMLLEREGLLVKSARDGEEALEIIGRDGAPELLLTDVVLPGMNGVSLATRLREASPALKVVFMSGYPAESTKLLKQECFIEKPFSTRRLLAMIRGQLAGLRC